MKNKIFAVIFLFAVLSPLSAAAQTNPCTTGENGQNGNLGQCVGRIYVWSLGVAALLALVSIIFGGYMVITASGNAEQASRGKSYIVSSVIGLGLLLGAYIILNTINPDLLNFNIRGFNTAAPQTNLRPGQ